MIKKNLFDSFVMLVEELERGELTSREKFILTTAIWAGTNMGDAKVFEYLTKITKIILGPKSSKKFDHSESDEISGLIKKITKFDN